MHKRKDGKIIASLTEVKNKTGDIFALVDEFGEVTLTSYNKPKYRITKVDIMETLKIDEKDDEKPEEEKKSVIKKVAETFKPAKEEKVEEPEVVSPEPMEQPESTEETKTESDIDLKVWDRNSKDEKDFTKNLLRPIQ
ncbi:hypothetical protein KC669_00520 [Candidatus Dojkabacteria bacterium]|uniref:Uncharacterized protein n=1 Tax=Candidatus Dojkabacteria bacterium TaxID=2099670 RepID=A0A955L9G9_9BACT|nr:hypothetical protein [Candidatus Dojkabacteria bacterium]